MGRVLGVIVAAAIAVSSFSGAPAHKHHRRPLIAAQAAVRTEQAQFYCTRSSGIALLDAIRRYKEDGPLRAAEFTIRLLSFPKKSGCELGTISGGSVLPIMESADGTTIAVCRARNPDDVRKWAYYLPFSKTDEKVRC